MISAPAVYAIACESCVIVVIGGVPKFAGGNVIEADDLYVVGNTIAGFLQCVDAAERYHIG